MEKDLSLSRLMKLKFPHGGLVSLPKKEWRRAKESPAIIWGRRMRATNRVRAPGKGTAGAKSLLIYRPKNSRIILKKCLNFLVFSQRAIAPFLKSAKNTIRFHARVRALFFILREHFLRQ